VDQGVGDHGVDPLVAAVVEEDQLPEEEHDAGEADDDQDTVHTPQLGASAALPSAGKGFLPSIVGVRLHRRHLPHDFA
jgi:hypothetical protein